MGAQACTNAALRHAPALRATPVSFSHTPIKYITHSALHANGARPRTATLLLPSPSGQRYRRRRSRFTAPVSGSSTVPGLLRSQLQRNNQQQVSAHPFRNLLMPAAALLLLSKIIDGKGLLLACSWLMSQVAPWPCIMWATAIWMLPHNLSWSVTLFVLAPPVGLLSALGYCSPRLMPAQHLVELTVNYPYFHGPVSIPRICAMWIRQQQGLCTFLNATLAWGPWVLVSLAVFLQCAVWLERAMRGKPSLERAGVTAMSMVNLPQMEAGTDKPAHSAAASLYSTLSTTNGVEASYETHTVGEGDKQETVSQPGSAADPDLRVAGPKKGGSGLKKATLQATQAFDTASLGDRNALARNKFNTQAAAAAAVQGTSQNPLQGSGNSPLQSMGTDGLNHASYAGVHESDHATHPVQMSDGSVNSAGLSSIDSTKQSMTDQQEQTLASNGRGVLSQQECDEQSADSLNAPRRASGQASDRARLPVDYTSDAGSGPTPITHPEWAIGWVLGGGFEPGRRRRSSQAVKASDTSTATSAHSASSKAPLSAPDAVTVTAADKASDAASVAASDAATGIPVGKASNKVADAAGSPETVMPNSYPDKVSGIATEASHTVLKQELEAMKLTSQLFDLVTSSEGLRNSDAALGKAQQLIQELQALQAATAEAAATASAGIAALTAEVKQLRAADKQKASEVMSKQAKAVSPFLEDPGAAQYGSASAQQPHQAAPVQATPDQARPVAPQAKLHAAYAAAKANPQAAFVPNASTPTPPALSGRSPDKNGSFDVKVEFVGEMDDSGDWTCVQPSTALGSSMEQARLTASCDVSDGDGAVEVLVHKTLLL